MFMQYLLYYVIFTVSIYLLLIFFNALHNKVEPDKDSKLFDEEIEILFVSFVPIINVFYLFAIIWLYISSYLERKFHPENTSFKILKEILCLYTDSSYAIEHFSKFIDKLKRNIEILETKLDVESYKNLLVQYDFTFARIISILKESSKLNENTQNKVLLTSKELIDGFLEESQQLLDKDNEMEFETQEVILNRFMKELEEEKIVQSRQMKYTKIS
jgi:hypothetical protein